MRQDYGVEYNRFMDQIQQVEGFTFQNPTGVSPKGYVVNRVEALVNYVGDPAWGIEDCLNEILIAATVDGIRTLSRCLHKADFENCYKNPL